MQHITAKHWPALLATAALWAGAAQAQVNMDAYREYFLVGQFGEVCTMCEVTVVCQAGAAVPDDTAVPTGGSFTLYHLQTRTFWSQVSTIWEWFISNFRQDELASRGHVRPVHVYEVKDGVWPAKSVIEGRLVLDPGVLEFGDRTINRIDRSWHDAATDEPLGYCARSPLWDTLDIIAAEAPGGGA